MLDERQEIIEFNSYIPMKVFIHKPSFVAKHWHSSLELLMILDGVVHITVDEVSYDLREEDVILINSNSIHEIHSEGAVMIAVQIELSMFKQFQTDLSSLVFDCNSAAGQEYERFDNIRFAIASLIQSNTTHSDGIDYLNYSLSYYLIAQFLNDFKAEHSETLKSQQKYMERLTRIISYINKHYAENFSLNDLAEKEGLSVPYLSQFFNKHMGVNFTQYYNSIKLKHALSDLADTNDSIESIAIRNGFTESHSFVRAFKKEYQMLPSEYRRQQKNTNSEITQQNDINYLLIEPSNYLKSLTKYLNNGSANNPRKTSIGRKILNAAPVSCKEPLMALHHTFKRFIGVGRAKDLLNHNIQEMLRDLQANIGYEYIKFHGILSDDMMVVNRVNGELKFHYTLVDMVIDFIVSIGLKPMIQFSFMPKELAAYPGRTIFYSPLITSPPADMNEWNLLIHDFTNHLIQRYGRENVQKWMFTVWNEPSTSQKMFGFGDDNLFFSFYKNTYETVKKIDPDFRFGSPSFFYTEHIGDSGWMKRFLLYSFENHCRPDFILIHYYADILPSATAVIGLNQVNVTHTSFPKNTDDFSLFIGAVKKEIRTIGAGDLPIYLTEWNFTLSHQNLINDTSFKTCYIMKNLLKNYDRLESFGYWSLTDLIEENALPDILFHGGLGVYTSNGLRKGVFYAFYFANMLGDSLLANGDGFFITKRNDSYQIITYHYIHYGNLFANGELFDITETHRYSAFDTSKRMVISVPLTDIKNGDYMVKEYFVNRNHGNAYDLWIDMGAIPLSPQDTDLLRGLCVPGFFQSHLYASKHCLTYTADLEPFEIRFAELTPINV